MATYESQTRNLGSKPGSWQVPTVRINYDILPVVVQYGEKKNSFYTFITRFGTQSIKEGEDYVERWTERRRVREKKRAGPLSSEAQWLCLCVRDRGHV